MLHHDANGYVAHCADCNRFQTAFGNVVLSLSCGDFYALAIAVSAKANDHRHCSGCGVKDIFLDTPADNMLFVFSGIELERLNDMIQQALLLAEAKRLAG